MHFNYFSLFLAMILFIGCRNSSGNGFLATGIIEGTAVRVAAQTGGYILNVCVEEGKDVELGQIIAVIDTEKLIYQLQQIEAGLEGVMVQHQINLNTVERATLDYEHIKRKYKRYQDLYKKNSASEQVLDDLKQAYDAAQTLLENAQQSSKVVGISGNYIRRYISAFLKKLSDRLGVNFQLAGLTNIS